MAAEKNFFDDKNNFARDDFYHRKPYIDHFGSFSIERFEALSGDMTTIFFVSSSERELT